MSSFVLTTQSMKVERIERSAERALALVLREFDESIDQRASASLLQRNGVTGLRRLQPKLPAGDPRSEARRQRVGLRVTRVTREVYQMSQSVLIPWVGCADVLSIRSCRGGSSVVFCAGGSRAHSNSISR
jgi:hypothetical protein